MNRRGMALLLVLWTLVLLTGLAAVGLGGARTGSLAARNRLALLRAGWAREACLEILLGRVTAAPPSEWEPDRLGLDSVDLGDELWCRLKLYDPGKLVNVNLASREALLALVGDTALTEALIRGRPWPATEAIIELQVEGGALDPQLCRLVTVRGSGRVNLTRAPLAVLRTVPGLSDEGARALIARRAVRQPFRSPEEVLAELPAAPRERVLARYQEFLALAEVGPEVLIAEVVGHDRDRSLPARMTVTLVPAGTRLAVIRRETE